MIALTLPFAAAARYGRSLLVAGLAVGIALPQLALAMKPWLPELVAGLLFVAALRIGPRQAVGAMRDLPVSLGLALFYQLVLPVAAIMIMKAGGWLDTSIAMALVLMLSAPSISGSPNLTIMTGHDPAPALRLLILGTALLPVTVLAPLWLLPELGSGGEVLAAAARLLGVIAVAASAAFLIRGFVLRQPSPDTIRTLDGVSAIAMAVVVVGLMSAVGPAITETPMRFLYWLLVACAANLGAQAIMARILKGTPLRADRAAFGIIAGNRNIALFLIALPPEVTDPLLLFIGCYQIPMYLTPILMRRFYGNGKA